MFVEAAQAGTFQVEVETSNNGGHSPEFWARRAADRIVQVADSAHPAIREQAQAYKAAIELVVLEHINRAIKCDRSTVSYLVSEAGHPQLAEHLRRL
jgi:hypothetical protein